MVSAVDNSDVASHTRVLAENLAKLNVAPDILGRSLGRQNRVLEMAGSSASVKKSTMTRVEFREIRRLTKRNAVISGDIAQLEKKLQRAIKAGNKPEVEALRKDRQTLVDERKGNQDSVKNINESVQERGKAAAAQLKEDMHALNVQNHVSTGFLRGIDPFMGSMAVDYIAETDKTAEDAEAASSYASAGAGGLGTIPGQIGSYLSFGTSRN